MRYPLPHNHTFQIRRTGHMEGNRHMVQARLLGAIGNIIEEIECPSSYGRPTCRLSAGDVLRFMLCNDSADSIREKLGNSYDAIQKVALDMAGLESTLCKSISE